MYKRQSCKKAMSTYKGKFYLHKGHYNIIGGGAYIKQKYHMGQKPKDFTMDLFNNSFCIYHIYFKESCHWAPFKKIFDIFRESSQSVYLNWKRVRFFVAPCLNDAKNYSKWLPPERVCYHTITLIQKMTHSAKWMDFVYLLNAQKALFNIVEQITLRHIYLIPARCYLEQFRAVKRRNYGC